MTARCTLILLGFGWLWALPTLAVEPIPLDKRVVCHVERYLTAPDDTPMHMPTDVAVDSRGQVYVADGVNHRIVCFDAEGAFQGQIQSFPNLALDGPMGLFVDADDRLWIADASAARLVILDAKRNLQQVIALADELPEIDPNEDFEPTDVVITRNGAKTYVVDNNHHCLFVRDNTAARWQRLGRMGRALGQFEWPFMICLGIQEYVYVTEAIGARVQMISPREAWAGQIGQWGIQLGRFYRPKGIAADATGQLYVGDSTLAVIQVFSPWGDVVGVLTDETGNLTRFAHPMGLTFDTGGKLYVVELAAHRVAVVTLAQNSSSPNQPSPPGD